MHYKLSMLITKGIETMYSFETEKGRRNGEGKVIFQSEKEKNKGEKGQDE